MSGLVVNGHYHDHCISDEEISRQGEDASDVETAMRLIGAHCQGAGRIVFEACDCFCETRFFNSAGRFNSTMVVSNYKPKISPGIRTRRKAVLLSASLAEWLRRQTQGNIICVFCFTFVSTGSNPVGRIMTRPCTDTRQFFF